MLPDDLMVTGIASGASTFPAYDRCDEIYKRRIVAVMGNPTGISHLRAQQEEAWVGIFL
jgi:hypothetical protein